MRLLLIPGLDGTGQLFRRLVDALAGRVAATIVSLPLNGGRTHADVAARITEALGDGPAVLLGESFSGPAAIMVAAKSPAHVKGLVLASTFVEPPLPPFLIAVLARIDPKWFPAALLRAFMMGRWGDDALARELEELVDILPAETIRARLQAVACVDVRDDVQRIGCPILVLEPQHDWLVPTRSLRSSTRDCAHVRIKEMAGPHMLLQANPVAAADEIVRFVQTLKRG